MLDHQTIPTNVKKKPFNTSNPWMGSLAANCSHCTRSRSICWRTPNEIAFTFSSKIIDNRDLEDNKLEHYSICKMSQNTILKRTILRKRQHKKKEHLLSIHILVWHKLTLRDADRPTCTSFEPTWSGGSWKKGRRSLGMRSRKKMIFYSSKVI